MVNRFELLHWEYLCLMKKNKLYSKSQLMNAAFLS